MMQTRRWLTVLLALSSAGCEGDSSSGSENGDAGLASASGDAAATGRGSSEAGPPGGEEPDVDAESNTMDAGLGGASGDSAAAAGASSPGAPPVSGSSGNGIDPNSISQDLLFTCDGSASSSAARLRRLSRSEWVRATGSSETGYKSSEVARTNPLAPPPGAPYGTWAKGAGLDPTTLDLYLGVLADTVRPWMGRDLRRTPRTYDDGQLRCMFNDVEPDDECKAYYLTSLLEDGVLYRPPTSGEMARLRALLETALADEVDQAERPVTLERVASAAWVQSGALFRSEMGQGAADADGRRRLSDWELAHALAFMISDRPPGAMGTYRFSEGPDGSSWTPANAMAGYLPEIESAARDGSIQEPSVIRSLISSYSMGIDPERIDLNADQGTGHRAARGEFWVGQKLQHFFREWLDYEDVALVFKDTPYKTSRFEFEPFDGELRFSINASWGNLSSGYYGDESLLIQQLDDVIARVVVEDENVLSNLLTTRRFFVASNTAGGSTAKSTSNTHRPYNLDVDIPATTEGRWVEMPPDERAGVLTHPAFLAAHGGNFEDDANVVHRGKWIREQLLCESVPGLELVMVEALLVPSDPEKTGRDRIQESIEGNAACMGCHGLMNSLGYPFEIYNHAGFLRSEDHGRAPDGSSLLANMPDASLNGAVNDAIELAEKLAGSNHVKRCFIRQSFRYFMGRNESLQDACALTSMEEAYEESGGSFISLLQALATSDTFLYRHDQETE